MSYEDFSRKVRLKRTKLVAFASVHNETSRRRFNKLVLSIGGKTFMCNPLNVNVERVQKVAVT